MLAVASMVTIIWCVLLFCYGGGVGMRKFEHRYQKADKKYCILEINLAETEYRYLIQALPTYIENYHKHQKHSPVNFLEHG